VYLNTTDIFLSTATSKEVFFDSNEEINVKTLVVEIEKALSWRE